MTASLIAYALIAISPLIAVLTLPFLAISAGDYSIISGVSALIALVLFVVPLTIFPTFVYAHVRQIGGKLSGEQEMLSFIPAIANWRRGLGDELVFFIGVLSVAPFLIGVPSYLVDGVIAIVLPIAFVATAYCYHFRVLFHRRQERSRKRANLNRNRQVLHKRKEKSPTTIVDDPIELELMQLRRDLNDDR
ncbi:hypothetical protein [Roseofilum sp. SBFL]|uniref:hypothetical protein n=1 Tax=Roseofilum sp. SBFL TaxID=2821496 RepID=UPI00298DC4EB|nr:hypothetical protein [Roseofilum sp. SBFL]